MSRRRRIFIAFAAIVVFVITAAVAGVPRIRKLSKPNDSPAASCEALNRTVNRLPVPTIGA